MNKLDSLTETQVVAMIARGDTYDKIIETLSDRNISITRGSLTAIKKRNEEALSYMQGVMVDQATSHATTILQKSRQLLENKLDNEYKLDNEIMELRQDLDDGLIDKETYWHKLEQISRRRLSASELNAIAKESFNQSQVEQGKPSSITESPAQAKANLEKLLTAIKTGDDRSIIKTIFPDA